MKFEETPLKGAYVLEPERIEDDRGFFTRIWCGDELRKHGLSDCIVQSNLGFSNRKGTLRGLHYQLEPNAEVKLLRCSKGAVYDVIVDLRPDSPTHERWFGIELNEENRKMIYVPTGFAQGYLTLRDDSEIYYHTSEVYHPEVASGVRYDDPSFGINWPIGVEIASEQDRNWPDYRGRA